MDGIGGVVDGTALADAGGAEGGAADGAGGADQGAGGGEGGGTEGQGDGAGDEGGAGGDGGDGAGDDAGAGEGGEEGELGEVGDEGGEEGDDADLADADGRRVDAKTRQDLAALKKVNPESAKRLGDMYHRSRTLMEEVGAKTLSEAVHKVRQINATLEGVGGADGLTELQDEVGDYRNEIKQFSEGDPALLQQLQEANPESFATAMVNGLDLLAEKSPKVYDRAIVGHIVARLESGNVFNALNEVVEFVKAGEGQKAYDRLGDINAFLNNAKKMAEGHKAARTQHNPEREELERGRQELQSEKRQIFEGGVAEDVNRLNNRATLKLVDPFVRDIKLKQGGRREFVNALNSRIYAQMAKDKAFQRAAHALLDKGDRDRAARFTHAKFAELLPDAFRTLRNEMYPSYKPARVAPKTGGNGASGGAGKKDAAAGGGAPAAKVVPGKLYKRAEVDIVGTPDVYLVQGKAYLKGTKTIVKYDQSSPRV